MISGTLRSTNGQNARKLAQDWRRMILKPANQVPNGAVVDGGFSNWPGARFGGTSGGPFGTASDSRKGNVGRTGPNEVGYVGADALPRQSLIAVKRLEEYWLAPIR